MLQPHPASPLEYWFFKFNHPGVALLVDWIARREARAGLLRISIHSPTAREVIFLDHPAILEGGASELSLQATSWGQGEIRWQLNLEASPDRIRPQIFPSEQLKLFDMSLASAPQVTFNGWVEHRGDRYPVVAAPGMISHYWGRALPHEWWWVSANAFSDPDIAVECMLLRSRVWGIPLKAPLGYFYYRNGPDSALLTSPPYRMSATGSPQGFEIIIGSPGKARFSLRAAGREYAALGEGILNTLTGDLELWQEGKLVAQAGGTAGLERRDPAGGG